MFRGLPLSLNTGRIVYSQTVCLKSALLKTVKRYFFFVESLPGDVSMYVKTFNRFDDDIQMGYRKCGFISDNCFC